MSESSHKKQRPSPNRPIAATPNSYLGPSTPFRRAASAGPTPGSRKTPLVRTPGTGRTPRGGPATRPLQLRRVAPTTPHAIRALRERANAARTPGHNRRRSGRIQRETPRDILRDLSRALARDTQPVQPSPQIDPRRNRHSALDLSDVEDGPDPAAPRLSMPLDDMYDDESMHDLPPRQSLLPDLPDDVDGGTVQSLELGRRAFSEDPRFMFPGRGSERFADLSELGAVEEEYEVDGTFVSRRDGLLDRTIDEALDEDDTTTQIRALTERRDGRQSDVDLGVFGDADDDTEEPTFRFLIPVRMRAPMLEQEQNEQDEDTQENSPPISNKSYEEPEQSEDEEQVEITGALNDENPTEQLGIQGWESDDGLDDDADLALYREQESAMDRSLQTQSPERPTAKQQSTRKAKELRISQRGLEYPSFPAASVKKLALGFMKSQGSKAQLKKDALAALVKVTDDFFEQIGIDLAAYAQHGGRKMIEESDVIALMKRTRKTTNSSTSFSLAQKMLPRELLQQLRMEPPQKLRGQKRKRPNGVQEEGG
ncbi:centromere kinetochore component CENP-T-domain-containing protein [Ampelomyces quisqualis]|uniref:Centromere kinetochore component CENP-T-domain-containing protein n=1 Tax=Ampelomyces quisqualis TaxID=50730 RepID=A0A6A5QDU4_AMPQU|nr:centromere kinetochore component CENP-T-domain-containing protein [Ampelomyces quisqualis]